MLAIPGLDDLLRQQPMLRLEPVTDDFVWLTGDYHLDVTHTSAGRVTRSYSLRIATPSAFPHDYPIVFEVGSVIPRHPDWHVNTHDGSLCLGSRLGLKLELKARPHLTEFLSVTLDPYLYAVTVKLETGRPFVFGELRHGNDGVVQDLAERLGIPENAAARAFDILAMQDTAARLQVCLCGCGQVLGECETYSRFRAIRELESPVWFSKMASQLAAK